MLLLKKIEKGFRNIFSKIRSEFQVAKKNKPAFGRFKEQKLLRVAIKFFAQKILHKIPCFWDFTFVFFNKRLSAHANFIISKLTWTFADIYGHFEKYITGTFKNVYFLFKRFFIFKRLKILTYKKNALIKCQGV